jgi:glycosyltransferase involved in cell wall biosynthesis
MVDAVTSPSPPQAAASGEPPRRVIFDLTTTAMWSGPPVGIVRVESEFGRFALGHVEEMVPAFFDPETRAFRHLSRDTAGSLIAQDAAIDTLSFISPARRGKRKTDRIPAALRPLALWVLQARRVALQALERLRLRTASARAAAFADAAQRVIMNDKYRAIMMKADGSRRAYLPIDLALGAPIDLTARDTLVCSGAGWAHTDIEAIAELKREVGFRFVLFCFDIIPLKFPHYYKQADVAAHRDYCHRAFPPADLVVFSSRTVEADVRAYCGAHGLALGRTAVMALGAHIRAPAAAEPLPAGLERGRYALLVSTIEPRKGHRLICDAWLKLFEAGVPQRARFKLAFAGRVGWMIADLMRDLRGDPRLAGSIALFTDADDAKVSALYRDAAFCLYPSHYEGYGLPAVEAFQFGKAVLASTGGAVPEVVGDFSPCLPPDDGEAWRRMLQLWIEDPAARAVYEERIRTSFRHPDWDESARTFFALVRGAKEEVS